MKTKLIALVLAAAMVLSMAACGSASSSAGSAAGSGTAAASTAEGGATTETMPKDFTLAYAAVTTSLAPWVVAIANSMEAMCKKNGWNYIPYDGEGNVDTQTSQIASIISDGEADLVVLFPVVSDAAVQYVADLTAANIPVITLGSDVSEAGQKDVKCYVGPDQAGMVQYGADYIKKTLGTDKALNYVILSGFEGQYDYIVREAAVKKDFEGTKYNCLNTVYCGAARADAMENMSTFLSGKDQIDFVFALSDEFALGAIQAIDDAGMTGKITVVSMEAFNEGVQAIKDGKLALSVTMSGQSVVDKLEEVIPKVMNGEKIDYIQSSETVEVTKDNADSITCEY